MAYQSVFAATAFQGKTIIITGGGSGIGRCTAHELASLGAKVIITGRKQEKLDKTIAEIVEDGGVAAGYAFDIRDEEAVKANVKLMLEQHGAIHGLVNNAGGQFPMPVALISKKGFEAVVANNLTGGFLMSRELFNAHFKKNGGTIVNMLADMWGGMPGMAHSGAARAGMMNLTETCATEWASAGVRVNAVAPGFVASSGMDQYDPAFTAQVIPQMAATIPLKRLSEEAEISAAIVFLLSDAASFITGHTIKIDGGASLNTKLFPLVGKGTLPFAGFHRAVKPKAVGG
ncbi:MAG: SDR family oxidoreductase [Pseudomonadota bacterium]